MTQVPQDQKGKLTVRNKYEVIANGKLTRQFLDDKEVEFMLSQGYIVKKI
jgi:hypothetical protein